MIGREVEVPQVIGQPAPRYVLPSAAGWAYGDFTLDPITLEYLMANLPDVGDPLTRGSAWVTLWDALLRGQVRPDAFLDLAMRSLPRETDEQMVSRVLGYASNTWWRFLDQGERNTRAARFESLLREGLSQAGTASQKASWFGTLRNVSVTPGTVTWLRQVWEKKDSVTGLPLAEADYTALALELAVRQVDGWSSILDTQLARIENPDRKARFQFVMPALSADPADAREMVRVVARCEQPPARAVGARRARLPPSPAARRGLEEIRATQPGIAVGNPEDRRHFLPEAVARRDLQRPHDA